MWADIFRRYNIVPPTCSQCDTVEMVFCKNCGETVTQGIRFCENCGAPVDDPPRPMYQRPTEPSAFQGSPAPDRSKRIGVSIIGGIVFGFIGATMGGLPGLIIGFIIGAVAAAYGFARVSVN